MKKSPYLLIPASILLTLIILKIFHLSIPLGIVSRSQAVSEFSVVGEGKVDAIPDVAFVDVGVVVSKAVSADSAQKKVDEVHNAIVTAVKTFGIPPEDVKTLHYNVSPDYNYSDTANRIAGYNGNATISIKMTDKSQVGKVTQAAVAAGANEVQNTRFEVAHPEKYREMARDKAIEDAKAQADKLSVKLGIRLGAITNMLETSMPQPMPYGGGYAKSFESAAAPADLQPGVQTISSQVTLYFERR
jgi:uncharacterized protein YggE